MLAEQTIETSILTFIREQLNPGAVVEIDPEDNLFTSGLIDSVGAMRLIAHVEAILEIKIPPPDLIPANFRTVRVMAAYLHGLTKP